MGSCGSLDMLTLSTHLLSCDGLGVSIVELRVMVR